MTDLMPLFLKGITLGLSAGVAPGPLTLLVITQTLRYGFLDGMKIGFAPLITDIPIIAICVFISTHFAQTPLFIASVSFLGSCFLLKMAFDNWNAEPISSIPDVGDRAPLIRGAITNLLNPHPYLFWLTIGSPLILQSAAPPLVAGATFTAGMFIFMIGTKLCIAWIASKFRESLAGSRYRWALRVSSASLFFFSLSFLREGLQQLGLNL
jgi:threonine/homoserine/homoserine lactone efflux protein